MFRAVLDARNVARFWRVTDVERLPGTVRWPAIIELPLPELMPLELRDGFRHCLQEAWRRCTTALFRFRCITGPAEERLLVASRGPNETLTVFIYAMPSTETEASGGGMGSVGGMAWLAGFMVIQGIVRVWSWVTEVWGHVLVGVVPL